MKRLLFAIPLAAVALSATGPARADDVLYKCVDGKGAVSIQSAPCPKTSKEVWKRDTAAMAASAATLPPLPPASVTTPAASSPRNPPERPAAPGTMPPPRPPAKPGPPGPPPPGKPAPPPPPERSLSSASVESMAAIGPVAPAAPTAPVTLTAPPDPCDHAKDVAAQLRDMPWLELTPDQQQRLVRWVMEQCRPADKPN